MSNPEWHRNNPIPIYPRTNVLGWHLRHEAACGCRPIPDDVLQELDAMGFVLAGHVDIEGQCRRLLARPPVEPAPALAGTAQALPR